MWCLVLLSCTGHTSWECPALFLCCIAGYPTFGTGQLFVECRKPAARARCCSETEPVPELPAVPWPHAVLPREALSSGSFKTRSFSWHQPSPGSAPAEKAWLGDGRLWDCFGGSGAGDALAFAPYSAGWELSVTPQVP